MGLMGTCRGSGREASWPLVLLFMPVAGASGVGCVILLPVVENEKCCCKPMFKRHMWERGVLWGWCGRWFDHLVVCDVWEVGGVRWLLKNKKSPVNRCLQGRPESVGI